MSTTPPPPPPPPPPAYPGPAGGGPAMQNGPGTTAFVTGILSFLVCPIILSIVAIVQGSKGEQLAAQGLANNGDLAKWGKILGIISLVLAIIGFILALVFGIFGAIFGS